MAKTYIIAPNFTTRLHQLLLTLILIPLCPCPAMKVRHPSLVMALSFLPTMEIPLRVCRSHQTYFQHSILPSTSNPIPSTAELFLGDIIRTPLFVELVPLNRSYFAIPPSDALDSDIKPGF
jgi:hypothetical protein